MLEILYDTTTNRVRGWCADPNQFGGDMAFAIALEVCEAAGVTIGALIVVPRKI